MQASFTLLALERSGVVEGGAVLRPDIAEDSEALRACAAEQRLQQVAEPPRAALPASPFKISQLYTPVGSPSRRKGGSSSFSPLPARRPLAAAAAKLLSANGSASANCSPVMARRARPPSAVPARYWYY